MCLSKFLVLFIALAVACAATAFCGEKTVNKKDVPLAVLKAFGSAYPKASIKNCIKDESSTGITYEIESKDGRVSRDITYAPTGEARETEERVFPADLPVAVLDALKAKYSQGAAKYAEKNIKGNTVTYEVLVRQGKKKAEVVFSEDGREVLPKKVKLCGVQNRRRP